MCAFENLYGKEYVFGELLRAIARRVPALATLPTYRIVVAIALMQKEQEIWKTIFERIPSKWMDVLL